MKIRVNGEELDATPEQEAEILSAQQKMRTEIEPYYLLIDLLIGEVAKQRNYKNAVSCASYFNSTNIQWAAEAQAFIQWRDIFLEYAYEYLQLLQNGQIENPSFENFQQNMPMITWPEPQEN